MSAIAKALSSFSVPASADIVTQPSSSLVDAVAERLDASALSQTNVMQMVVSQLKDMREESFKMNAAILEQLRRINQEK
jgi:hypothetical protein